MQVVTFSRDEVGDIFASRGHPSSFHTKQALVRGSRGYTKAAIEEALEHIKQHKTNFCSIVTARYPHAQFPEAMAAAVAGGKNLKVLIDYDLD